MSKARKFLVMLTICMSNFILMAACYIGPVVNNLYALFPNNVGAVNFVVSGQYFVILVCTTFVGKLCRFVSKKWLLLIGSGLALVGGVCFLLIETPTWLVAMAVLRAIGYSLTYVCALGYLKDMFSAEGEYSSGIAVFNIAMTVVGVIISALAGKLATMSVSAPFQIYWVVAVYIVLLIFCVPSIKPVKNENIPSTIDERSATKQRLGFTYWGNVGNFLLHAFCISAPLAFCSMYVAENNLGNETIAGFVSSAGSIAGFVFMLGFAWMFKKFKRNLSTVFYVITTLSLAVCWKVFTVPTTIVGFAIPCGAWSITNSFLLAYFVSFVPQKCSDDAIAYLTALSTGVNCIIAYVVMWLMGRTSTGTFTSILGLIVGASALTVVMDIIMRIIEKKKGIEVKEV